MSGGLDGALSRLAGVPVAMVAHDTWAAVAGLGALRAGFGYNISGTSEVFGMLTQRGVSAPGLLTLAWRNGLYQIGGPSQVGAASLRWALDLIGERGGIAAAQRTVMRLATESQPLVFLPFLQGERAPFWDPELRGAFLGLNQGHGPADMALAVLEGTALLNRLVLERAETAADSAVKEIRMGGGGASNALWRRVKANALQRDIVTVTAPEPGLAGCDLTARVMLGDFRDLDAAQAALTTQQSRETPDRTQARFYDDLARIFTAAEKSLAPISRELARLRRPETEAG